jgi:hypothetical protein
VGAWRAARERGEVDVPREVVLFFETPEPGVVVVNTSRVTGLRATDPFELSQAEMIGRRQCQQIFRFLRNHAPGFANAVRMDTAAKIGVRESRHVRALVVLSAEDLLTSKPFDDAIAMGGYPIDIHSPGSAATDTTDLPPDTAYQIPLRSLLVEHPRNLIVVGRCIGASHEAAGGLRVTPIAMAIGQAGGVAAAVAVERGVDPVDAPYSVVRDVLETQGAQLPGREPIPVAAIGAEAPSH